MQPQDDKVKPLLLVKPEGRVPVRGKLGSVKPRLIVFHQLCWLNLQKLGNPLWLNLGPKNLQLSQVRRGYISCSAFHHRRTRRPARHEEQCPEQHPPAFGPVLQGLNQADVLKQDAENRLNSCLAERACSALRQSIELAVGQNKRSQLPSQKDVDH